MAKKHKKHEDHEGHANHERWVLSYADILTLLLALFIVMFAISKVDQKKFDEFARGTAESFGQANLALQGQQGALDGQNGVLDDQAPGQQEQVPSDQASDAKPLNVNQEALQRERARAAAADAQRKSLEKLKEQIAAQLKAKGLGSAVQMQVDQRGLVVNIITDRVLFDTGDATLRPAGAKVLDAIAPIVKELPNQVVVEGHTDNVPISGTFASNWELSTTRATTVLQRLITDKIPANRLSAAGYADQRPLTANTSDAGRARNRRVAIVVIPTVSLTDGGTTDGSGSSATSSAGSNASSSSSGAAASAAPSSAAAPSAAATP